jgi:hypothetical protein
MRLNALPIVLAVWMLSSLVLGAEDGPKEAFFAYRPVKGATYAVYNDGTWGKPFLRPFLVRRLEFDSVSTQLSFERPLAEDFENYVFRDDCLDPARSTGFICPEGTSITRGGRLPYLFAAWQKGACLGVLTPSWYRIAPLFMFPTFDKDGMTLERGQKWTTPTPPFVFPLTFRRLFRGELSAQTLPQTEITWHWRDWKRVNGYDCAVIDFSFEAGLGDDVPQDKKEGEYKLSGTSYFSVDLGFPVVNEIRAEGFFVEENGKKVDLKLLRREVLIDAEAAKDDDEGAR